MASKKPKSTRIQKSTQAQIYFFTNFKGGKTPNINSFYQMKPFDTNIIHFDGLNRCQRYFSFSTVGIHWPLSLLSQLGTKNNRNKLLHQNWIEKLLRYKNSKICMIFKVQGPKCIFYKTYGMPPMFDVFFISIPFFSILPFYKKSKLISF